MISDQLVGTLVDRNIINEETTVYVEYDKIDFSSRKLHIKEYFTVNLVFKNPETNKYFFRLIRKDNNEVILATCEQILEIDGMTPKLLAKAYCLRDEGDKEKLGKRRGRPRKWGIVNEAAEPDYEK